MAGLERVDVVSEDGDDDNEDDNNDDEDDEDDEDDAADVTDKAGEDKRADADGEAVGCELIAINLGRGACG